ncbi:MAG: glycosyltransferase [Candidatus Saganbacteria bacterium]|nr:glycosyltransferase [Candidatus Saganbacteria bacterium]
MAQEIKRELFKGKHAIFVVTHLCKPAIALFMESILPILDKHPDVVMAVIDSRSSDDIRKYLRSIKHERIVIEYLEENIGKARAANEFIAKYIDESNLPRTVWSMDPDIILDPLSFDFLLDAVQHIEGRIAVMGMRYKKNNCNPEMNLWFPAKKVLGKNGRIYSINIPSFCCVAGPVLAMKGEVLSKLLKFRLFPKKFVRVYGGDDSAIYLELKQQGYKMGYLNGTIVTHLKSGDKVAPEITAYEAAHP